MRDFHFLTISFKCKTILHYPQKKPFLKVGMIVLGILLLCCATISLVLDPYAETGEVILMGVIVPIVLLAWGFQKDCDKRLADVSATMDIDRKRIVFSYEEVNLHVREEYTFAQDNIFRCRMNPESTVVEISGIADVKSNIGRKDGQEHEKKR